MKGLLYKTSTVTKGLFYKTSTVTKGLFYKTSTVSKGLLYKTSTATVLTAAISSRGSSQLLLESKRETHSTTFSC